MTPFPFESLPQYSRQDADFFNAFSKLIDRLGFSNNLKTSLESFLLGHLGIPVTFQQGGFERISFQEIFQRMSGTSLYALFSLAPGSGRAILEMDSLLVQRCVDSLLGGAPLGSGTPSQISDKKATEMDQGVLSYLLLKFLSFLYEVLGRSPQVHFRLEGFETDKQHLSPLNKESSSTEDRPLLLSWNVEMGDISGFVRLVLPSSFLQRMTASQVTKQEEAILLDRMHRLDFLPVPLWMEIGKTVLKVEEVQKLEKGDILLLDETQIRLTPEKAIEGTVLLRVGKGQKTGILSTFVATSNEIYGSKLMVRTEKMVETYD